MWPFKKTLSERYSKLMKLIMSIDSHFEVTENKEESVRLHLPNYKGNQPMDFHICLMEPFLFINFVTEIEGEKISVVNNYPQDTDQQDMFNMVMANNMNRIHQVLEKKYKDEIDEEKLTAETNNSSDTSQESQSNGIPIEFAIEDLKEAFDYNESFKKHALTFLILRPKSEFWYYSHQDEEKPLWIYNDKNGDKEKGLYLMDDRYITGTFPFLWYLKKYEDKEELCWFFDFLNRHNMDLWTQEYAESTVNPSHPEELIKEMKRYVPSLNIRNNPQNIKVNLGWSWIDIQSMIRFIDYCMNNTDWTDKPNDRVRTLRDCSTLCDLAYLVMKDMGYDYNRSNQKEKDNEPTIIESWSLLEFAKENGAMKVTAQMTHVNTKTGEEYLKRKCAFVHPTKKDEQGKPLVLFVDFSSHLGELSPQEIAERKNELVVVKYESGRYALDRKQDVSDDGKTDTGLINTVMDGQGNEVGDCKLVKHLNTKLNDEQRYSLYYFAAMITGCMFFDNFNGMVPSKEALDILFDYKEELKLTDEEAELIVSENFDLRLEQLFGNIRTIEDDYEIQTLLMTCAMLVDLGCNKNAGKDFFRLVKELGLSEEDVKDKLRKKCFRNEKLFFDRVTITTEDDWIESVRIEGSVCNKAKSRLLVNTYGIKIPYGVSVICDEALKYQCIVCEDKDIIIPDSVTHIGDRAFLYQPIKSITIPNSVTYIGVNPFVGCKELEKVNCYSDKYVFVNGALFTSDMKTLIACLSKTSSFIIPNTVQIIGEFAFDGCIDLSSIVIPDSVLEIGNYSFSGCSSLVEISIPDSIMWIGCNPFIRCPKLERITCKSSRYVFHNKILYDNYETLISCLSKDEIIIVPDTVRTIWDYAFYGCNNLKKTVLPESTKYIGKSAFERCDSLIHIAIPQSVTSIGERAFSCCESLENISLPDGITTIEKCTFSCCSLKGVYIPNTVERICDSAFQGCESLAQVIIPRSVIYIGSLAFDSCFSLNDIFLPDSIIEVGDYAFSSLQRLYVKEGNKERFDQLLPEYKDIIIEQSTGNEEPSGIQDNWWADENGIPYIIDYMPSSSNSDNEETDGNLMNEDEVTPTEEKTDDNLENAWTDEHGAEYSIDKRQLIHVPEDVEEYSIAEGTEEIGDYAFVNIEYEDVSYDYIMENDLDIHDFERHPSKLVSVSIPNSVVKIGKGIFDWCTNLAVISIPEGTTERFKQWLPDYEDIFVEGDISTIAHLEDLEEIWTDEYGVKYSIDKRKLLKAPSDIAKCVILAGTKIICDGAFFECKNLNNIHLPESIRIIGKYVFYGCDSLTEINLPKAILRIGDHSFEECRLLESLYVSKNGYSQFAGMLPSFYDKIKESPLNSVIDEYGVVYDNDYQILHFNTLPLDTYTVKFGVKAIDDYAFKPAEWKKDDGKSLRRLVLPDSIVIVGVGAFCYNESLEYINIPPKTAFQSEKNPFVGCFNLHTIKWETHNAVKDGTLVYNRNKTSLVACLPWHYIDGVQKCWSLQSFAKQFGKMQVRDFVDQQTGEEFKSCVFTKPDGTHTFVEFSSTVDSIPPHMIPKMTNELQVVLMESGNYSLFKGKTIIEQESVVELPDGLETIAANAFYHNEVLKEIKMPDTITDIGKNAFEGCISLSSICIPLGTREKFEKLLPELKNILEEVDDLPF